MKDNKQDFSKNKMKTVWGWAIYDWANSAFATTIMAGFFPIFFKEFWSYGVDVNMSTARLGIAISVANLIVAFSAPFLGAIADQGKRKKTFLSIFAYFGIAMTAVLFFIPKGEWLWAVFFYALAIVGWFAANIFYDAFLPIIVTEDKLDHVSSLGYSLGYLGGGLLFALNVWMTLQPQFFGFPDVTTAVRFSFLSVAVWWGFFTAITLLMVPEEKKRHDKGSLQAIRNGLRQLKVTLVKLKHLKTVFLFLLAYWLYIDGVDTIVVMAIDYGMSIGFKSTDLILALLITQFVGFPSAMIVGHLGNRWGVKKTIFLTIGGYVFVCFWGMQITQVWEFYFLATVIGIIQGGIQALSRSYYARLIPENQSGEFFGFYNMLGKFATILGPVLMASVALSVKYFYREAPIENLHQLASRWSIASLVIIFFAGAIILYFVDEEEGRKEKKYLEDLKI